MRAQDIVDRLSAVLPSHTDGFSTSMPVTGITVSGAVATVTTGAPHNLVEGQNVAITGAGAPVQIDAGTFTRIGSSASFSTLQDHDITLSQRDVAAGGKTITISGAAEPEFNGVFQIAQVRNRRGLVIAVDDAGPVAISGAPLVDDANGGIFNGLVPATNVTPTTFEYPLPFAYPLPATTSGATVQTELRITSVLDFDSYLRDVYTRKALGADVLVVQLGDVTASKKRSEETDASSSASGEYSHTPVLVQPFAVYLVLNVTDQLTASAARDKVETEYVPAVFKSLLRAALPSGFTGSAFRATLTGHGVYAYSDSDKGRAVYAHEIAFEQLTQLGRADMVGPDDDVAMRDITLTLNSNIGTGVMTAEIDLDEEPLT